MSICKNCAHEIKEGSKHHKATGKPFCYYHQRLMNYINAQNEVVDFIANVKKCGIDGCICINPEPAFDKTFRAKRAKSFEPSEERR